MDRDRRHGAPTRSDLEFPVEYNREHERRGTARRAIGEIEPSAGAAAAILIGRYGVGPGPILVGR